MLEKIKEAARFIQTKITRKPDFAIVLGSGLSDLLNDIEVEVEILYTEIPHFPKATVEGHIGKLVFGNLEGKYVMMLAGRFHYYEGYNWDEVTFPIRSMKFLGIENIIISNASGGVNSDYKVGDIMIIKDHINFMPGHPLRGKNLDEFGPRFLDMSQVYDKEFMNIVDQVAIENDIKVHKGVYLGIQGPTFETPSEYHMIKLLGADAVGMSTVPEVIVARHQGMRVFAISVITDVGGKDLEVSVSHDEVLEAAQNATPKVIKLVHGLIKKA